MTDDRSFDAFLEDTLSDLPPDIDQTRDVTPWRKAMERVLWGAALTILTFNFWHLNTLLPAIGVALSWMGYRSLRWENGYFKLCWLISIYNVAAQAVNLIINATQWRLDEAAAWPVFVALSTVVDLVEMFCLWQGVRAVRRKAGQPDQAGAVAALMVWYVILLLIVTFGLGSSLFAWPLLIAYGCILYSLSKIPALLDEAGYEVEAAPIKVPDLPAMVIWLGALVGAISLAGLLFSRYPMEWTPIDPEEHAGLEEIKSNLLELGMPEEVLSDLSAEDLKRLEGANTILTRSDGHSFTQYTDDPAQVLFTHAAVALPDNRMRVIHHFEWVKAPPYRTTECIKLWPGYQGAEGYLEKRSDITGRLHYDLEGETYTGNYYSISEDTYDWESPLGLQSGTSTDPFLLFSLPLEGERLRGYLTYEIEVFSGEYLLSSWVNYVHQTGMVNYPMTTAEEYDKSGAWNFSDTFTRAQEALQFRPWEMGESFETK